MRKITFLGSLLIFLLMVSTTLMSQNICEGNLGENIFLNGDFGSGTQNILTPNPGIAPGYLYQTNPPPDDGFYVITNDISEWSWVYDTWLQVSDNSSDPNGYMMVVNASFDPGIFYESIVDNLCENTLYEFSADIINLIRTQASDHNDPNVDFLLDDVVIFSTGNIPKNQSWNKFGFTFTTNPGQTTLKLSLRNNAPGGIGNDLALDNISFRACGPSAFVNAETSVLLCENGQGLTISADIPQSQFIQWQLSTDSGDNWTDIIGATDFDIFHNDLTPGVYLYRYLSATTVENLTNSKCRILSDVFTVEVLPITFEEERLICEGINIEFGTQILSQTGIYEEVFISQSGCDSIVTLQLNVNPNPEFQIDYNYENPSCEGLQPGSITINSVNGAIEPFIYNINGQVSENPIFEDLSEGIYSITVTDSIGCLGTIAHELIEDAPFFVEIGSEYFLKLGETLDLNINHNYSLANISWIANNDISCSDCINPSIFPLKSGEYIVMAENEFGCISSDTIYVYLDDTKHIFIPNSFSPNGDGINDTFEIFPRENIITEITRFLIYDRWGNLITDESGNLSPSWDGKYYGKNAPSGIYTYLIEIEFIDNTVSQLTGTISIVK